MSLVRPGECRRRWGDRVAMSAPAASTGRSPALGNEIEAIEIHHLVPRSDEVTYELLLGVVACVDLREGSELGVRAEDEVDGRRRALERARGAIATLVYVR